MPRKKVLKPRKSHSRIDHFLNDSLPGLSRSSIEKLILSGGVRLNSLTVTRKNTTVGVQDRVEVDLPDSSSPDQPVRSAEFEKGMDRIRLFEDDHLVIINKPAGISVHPGAGRTQTTVLDIFRSRYPQIESIKNTDRPGIVHRLDKDTSGVLILAKDQTTMKQLQKDFKARAIKKEYLALVQGKMRYKHGLIDSPISRHGKHRKKYTTTPVEKGGKSRTAVTGYSVLLEFKDSSLVRLAPRTGRTHQLRVHLSGQGNPILGDPIYGNPRSLERLGLHAALIEFRHPVTGNIVTVNACLPPPMRHYIRSEIKKKNHEPNAEGDR